MGQHGGIRGGFRGLRSRLRIADKFANPDSGDFEPVKPLDERLERVRVYRSFPIQRRLKFTNMTPSVYLFDGASWLE